MQPITGRIFYPPKQRTQHTRTAKTLNQGRFRNLHRGISHVRHGKNTTSGAVDKSGGAGTLAGMKKLLSFLAVLFMAQVARADKDLALQTFPLKDINGNDTSLKSYAGKVVLLVNVASKCGNTPQYAGLESLYEKYKDKGLVVIGVPSNDFLGQEPGTAEEIKAFCSKTYGVTFPLMAKVHVKGKEKCPLYAALTSPDSPFPGEVKWNFGKFLIDRYGKVVNRFAPSVKPEAADLVQAVEAALK